MTKLSQVLEKNQVLYAIVSSTDGMIWNEYGDKNQLTFQGIVDSYFPGPEKMPYLDEFLEGQILPTTISQGNLNCTIFKPTNDRIVGAFLVDDSDVVTQMRRCRAIAAEVSELFKRT